MENSHSDSPTSRIDPGSYRDPGSRVFHLDGNVYRFIDERSLTNWERLSTTKFFAEGVASGQIVDTELDPEYALNDEDEWAAVLRHDRVPVISYPYEWTFSMLREAALLQLDLLLASLAEGMILKDSTPFNVQWRGTSPVFIDIGSFEILEEGEVWVGYRQFLAQYLYPLMLTANVGVRGHIGHRLCRTDILFHIQSDDRTIVPLGEVRIAEDDIFIRRTGDGAGIVHRRGV